MNANTQTIERIISIALNMPEAGTTALVDADTPLTEVFNSFALFDFLLHLEEAFEVEIDIESIPDNTQLTARTFAEHVARQQS